MKETETIQVKVLSVDQEAPAIKRFTLAAVDGGQLPRFTGGSHIIVHMRNGSAAFSNAYSLMGSPGHLGHYQIAVRKSETSKGGSVFMHESVSAGSVLEITPPANLFQLASNASKHLLIAGGIGITPFLSQLAELKEGAAPFELHYAYREGAFVDYLGSHYPEAALKFYPSGSGRRIKVSALLEQQPEGTHVYVCGPAGLNEEVINTAQALGWAKDNIHYEQFSVDATGNGFVVVLAQSGRELEVGPDETILKVMERAGLAVPCLCREGACGTCETTILDGEADHRDQYLTEAERAAQKTMMICVSRAKTARLVLDI